MQTARATLDAGLAAIKVGQIAIDLGQLNAVDSSAVATLLAWQRAALTAGHPLQLVNLPASLRSLIALYDVAELLDLHAAPPASAAHPT